MGKDKQRMHQDYLKSPEPTRHSFIEKNDEGRFSTLITIVAILAVMNIIILAIKFFVK